MKYNLFKVSAFSACIFNVSFAAFHKDALVSTSDGPVPMDLIRPGHMVLAYSPRLGSTGFSIVQAKNMASNNGFMVDINVGDRVIHAMPGQLLFDVALNSFVKARRLTSRHILFGEDSSLINIQDVKIRRRSSFSTPNEITVGNDHTLFVDGVLNHNMDPSKTPEAINAIFSVGEKVATWVGMGIAGWSLKKGLDAGWESLNAPRNPARGPRYPNFNPTTHPATAPRLNALESGDSLVSAFTPAAGGGSIGLDNHWNAAPKSYVDRLYEQNHEKWERDARKPRTREGKAAIKNLEMAELRRTHAEREMFSTPVQRAERVKAIPREVNNAPINKKVRKLSGHLLPDIKIMDRSAKQEVPQKRNPDDVIKSLQSLEGITESLESLSTSMDSFLNDEPIPFRPVAGDEVNRMERMWGLQEHMPASERPILNQRILDLEKHQVAIPVLTKTHMTAAQNNRERRLREAEERAVERERRAENERKHDAQMRSEHCQKGESARKERAADKAIEAANKKI
jgi:hypothetical protein